MTPFADMIEQMAVDGIPMSIIVLAVRTAELAVLVTASRDASRHASRDVMVPDRSPAAVRAARHRQKRKQNQGGAKANDVASADAGERDGRHDASRDGVTSHCDLSSTSSSVKGLIEEVSKEKKKEGVAQSARGVRMQPGAILTDEFRQAAINLGADPTRIPTMWAEFVDYWIGIPGQRGVKTIPNGWLATWRNRVRDVGARGVGRNNQGTGNVAENRSLVAAARRASERVAGALGLGDKPSEPVFRIVSQS
jgi:hypothetical protein